jgi:uncharacterized membrane protein YeiH
MIGRTPVGWMQDLEYVYVIAFVLSILFRRKFDKLRTSPFLFDTIGLGVFINWSGKGINIGLHPVICIALGTMSLFWWRYPRYFMQ